MVGFWGGEVLGWGWRFVVGIKVVVEVVMLRGRVTVCVIAGVMSSP